MKLLYYFGYKRKQMILKHYFRQIKFSSNINLKPIFVSPPISENKISAKAMAPKKSRFNPL